MFGKSGISLEKKISSNGQLAKPFFLLFEKQQFCTTVM
jgi:hypothetical protein